MDGDSIDNLGRTVDRGLSGRLRAGIGSCWVGVMLYGSILMNVVNAHW